MKRRLARAAFTNLDAMILDEMTHVQTELLERDAWLPDFLKTQLDVSVVGSHAAIPLSSVTGFIRPGQDQNDEAALRYLSNGYYVDVPRFDSFAKLKQIYGDGADRGEFPGGYYWDGNPVGNLQVRPQTTGTVNYQFNYYRQDPNTASNLDANGNCLWSRFAGDLLMHLAGLELATYLRDGDAVSYFGAKLQAAQVAVRRKKTADEMADQEYVMGD